MIYFDNNATTKVAPEVLDAMLPFLDDSFGNPSAGYSLGKQNSNAIAVAREAVADLVGAAEADEIVFTSGGTESDNWAILGTLEANQERDHIITTRVEHEAVRKLCQKLEAKRYSVTWLDVDENGELDLNQLRAALSDRTAIVSVMHANNETGVVFPIEQVADIVKERSSALIHVDGVNAAGKIPIDLKTTAIDLYSISGHKFNAPKGIGALYVHRSVGLPEWFTGGGQENGRRPGTEAVHQIAGLGAAASLAQDMPRTESIRNLRDRLESEILDKIPNSRLNGTPESKKRLPNTSNISFENTNGEAIIARLDNLGMCVSTGSACNSADHSVSPVLQAMNIPYSQAMGSVRFSLGRYNTLEEVDFMLKNLSNIVEDVRAIAV
ncbi:MAG: aminotransferase class V-fold PLP-dependent enzyme [Pyrinomonadaceae bacterium]